jgi:hypothetical protein
LEGADQVQDAAIGYAVQDGAAVTAAGDDAGSAEDSEVLAHVRDLAPDVPRQVPDRALAAIGEELEDAQPLRVRQGTGHRRGAVALCLGRESGGHHESDGISICAITQVVCDRRGVAGRADTPGMTVHLICPWCEDEVAFEVDRDSDELLCSACGTSFDFAPDPAVTYALLYEAA